MKKIIAANGVSNFSLRVQTVYEERNDCNKIVMKSKKNCSTV
jgi:hypothetical protein